MLELLEYLLQMIGRGGKKVIGLLYSLWLTFYRRLKSVISGDAYVASATAHEAGFLPLNLQVRK